MKKAISNICGVLIIIGIIVGVLDIFLTDGKNLYESSSYICIHIALLITFLINHYLKNKKGVENQTFGVLFILSLISFIIAIAINPAGIYRDMGYGSFIIALTLWSLSSLLGLVAILKNNSSK